MASTCNLSEADTRAKFIAPAIHKRGWTEELIRREETAGTVDIIDGKPHRRSKGKIDYVLRVMVNIDTQPVTLALIEAKKPASRRPNRPSAWRAWRCTSPTPGATSSPT